METIADEYMLDADNDQKDLCVINANDHEFPGISEIRLQLSDWNWCYGKTPDFSINRTFFLLSNASIISSITDNKNSIDNKLDITINIKKGRIVDILVKDPSQLELDYQSSYSHLNEDFKFVSTVLKERRFTDEALSILESSLKQKFLTE